MTWVRKTTAGTVTVVVPQGCTRAWFDVGGTATESNLVAFDDQQVGQAFGGRITGYMQVVPGETLYLTVGSFYNIPSPFVTPGGAAHPYPGGSSSSISTGQEPEDRIVVAGGAGGSYDSYFDGHVTFWGGNGSGGPTAEAGEGPTAGGGASGNAGGAGGYGGAAGNLGATANPSGSDTVYFSFPFGPGRTGNDGQFGLPGGGGVVSTTDSITVVNSSSGGGDGWYGGGSGGGGVAGYASPMSSLVPLVLTYAGAGGGGNGYHDTSRCSEVTEYMGTNRDPYVYMAFEDVTVYRVHPTLLTTLSSLTLQTTEIPNTIDFEDDGTIWMTNNTYTKVQHFNADGEFLFEIDSTQFGEVDQFRGIGGFEGTAYVCVLANTDFGGIYHVSSTGATRIVTNETLTANGQWRDVTVDPSGDIWAARRSATRTMTICQFNRVGTLQRTVTLRATDPTSDTTYQVGLPNGMKIRANVLWVRSTFGYVWQYNVRSNDTDVPTWYKSDGFDVPDEADFDVDYFYGSYGIEPGGAVDRTGTPAVIGAQVPTLRAIEPA